jgi:hypothetical protein
VVPVTRCLKCILLNLDLISHLMELDLNSSNICTKIRFNKQNFCVCIINKRFAHTIVIEVAKYVNLRFTHYRPFIRQQTSAKLKISVCLFAEYILKQK